MTLFLNLASYAQAAGVNRNTAARRLRTCPRHGIRRQTFDSAEVISRLLPQHRDYAGELIRASRDDGVLFCGGDEAMPTAQRLEKWVINNPDPAMAQRLAAVRVEYCRALGRVRVSSSGMFEVEHHRMLLPLSADILPFVVLGPPAKLPADWDGWCRSFAILHNAPADSGLKALVSA